MSSTLRQKPLVEPSRGIGTLYSLATNQENQCLYLYLPLSESFKTAAKRFLRMHQTPFAGGGYAGKFWRVQKEGTVLRHYGNETEFYYSLNRQGLLRVFQHPFESRCTLSFEGPWFDFVNQQAVQKEILYSVPSRYGCAPQILSLSAQSERIKVLDFLLDHQKSPQRFKEYVDFIAQCKTLIGALDA
jgi:hypothetical protein